MKKAIANLSFIVLIWLSFASSSFSQPVTSEKARIRINTLSSQKELVPDIQIIEPATLKEKVTFQSEKQSITIAMRLLNPLPGAKLYLNNTEVLPSAAGDLFIKSLDLNPGSNLLILEVRVNDNLIKEYVYSLAYIPSVKNISPQALNPGKYYAVIIGNGSYNDPGLPDLKRPVADAKALKEILTSRYTFDLENIYYLIDKNLESIIIVFDELQRKLKEDDNLLIFYAGHGNLDESSGLGYWLFSDAQLNSTFRWFPNSRLTDYISSYKAKHVLLIADACYAGSIYDTRGVLDGASESIQDLYKSKSRKAITSGGTSKVRDDSKFTEFMLEQLRENSSVFYTSGQLYHSILIPVQNNSENSPRWGAIQNVGDKGGDFVFILKQGK